MHFPPHTLVIVGLIATRLIGWGTTYYVPSVLASAFERDLGISSQFVFAGITVMLVISAFVAPMAGRYFDRHGTRGAMTAGAVGSAAGLVLLSQATGPVSYLISWVVTGLSCALTLQNASNVAVSHMMGEHTRRVISIMMLFTAFSSTLFWPVTEYLNNLVGWRQTCLIYAGLHLLICVPAHLNLPRGRQDLVVPPASEAARIALEGRLRPDDRRVAFWLIAVSMSLNGLVSWGLPLHLIHLFQTGGLTAVEAVAIASLLGPTQVLARLFEVIAGDRVPVERSSLLALGFLPLACLIPVFGGASATMAVIFMLIYGTCSGALSVARATLPLVLFGRRGYATLLGRLTVPQNLIFAIAPLLFAIVIERYGAASAFVLAACAQAASFLALGLLVRCISRPDR